MDTQEVSEGDVKRARSSHYSRNIDTGSGILTLNIDNITKRECPRLMEVSTSANPRLPREKRRNREDAQKEMSKKSAFSLPNKICTIMKKNNENEQGGNRGKR